MKLKPFHYLLAIGSVICLIGLLLTEVSLPAKTLIIGAAILLAAVTVWIMDAE